MEWGGTRISPWKRICPGVEAHRSPTPLNPHAEIAPGETSGGRWVFHRDPSRHHSDWAMPTSPTQDFMSDDPRTFDRELSWLAFNERVLQQAEDPTIPLIERLRFLAIVSSNLDEFFRVRVASLRSLLRLKKKKLLRLGIRPAKLLRNIHGVVHGQQERFGQVLRGDIMPGLRREGIELYDESTVPDEYHPFLRAYFEEHLADKVEATPLKGGADPVFLETGRIYLVVTMWDHDDSYVEVADPDYSLVTIPAECPRFVILSDGGSDHDSNSAVMYLDDVIRFNLDRGLPEKDLGGAFSVKLSRDADLLLDDEFSGDLVAKIRKSLGKRETGVPARFLFDMQAPFALVSNLRDVLALEDEDLVSGGRYHNMSDLFSFPDFGRKDLQYPEFVPGPHPTLGDAESILDACREQDHLLHYPYQAFDPVIRFLREAATDPTVEEVWISLYRVSRDSSVAKSLILAAQNGKRVTAFVEVKARFDEESNLLWADRMAEAGVRVLFSKPGIKVHTKLALVARADERKDRFIAYLATGNFNEKTAKIYTDLGLFTSDVRLTEEVRRVFALLAEEQETQAFEHLLVAPAGLRAGFEHLIDEEIAEANAGRPASMILKMNSLEDPTMIEHLYQASAAGVQIELIVRGICCLRPGVPGLSENITARSIVGRFLEHPRVYLFHAAGEQKLFVASADLMTRNLDRRVEVAFPIYDPDVKREIVAMLELQLADTKGARVLDEDQQNLFAEGPAGAGVDAQQVMLSKWAAAPT